MNRLLFAVALLTVVLFSQTASAQWHSTAPWPIYTEPVYTCPPVYVYPTPFYICPPPLYVSPPVFVGPTYYWHPNHWSRSELTGWNWVWVPGHWGTVPFYR